MRELPIFTTPEDAHVQMPHDAGVTFVGEPGTADGKPAHILKIDGVPDGNGAWLEITADGKVPIRQHGRLWISRDVVEFVPDIFVLEDARPFVAELSRLVVNGQFFQLEDGSPHTSIACSDFDLFEHFVHDVDIGPVCEERAAIGFNELRVFLAQHGGLGMFDPRPYLSSLQLFCETVHAYGLRLEVTVFPDAKRWIPDPQAGSGGIRSDISLAIWKAFRERGISR